MKITVYSKEENSEGLEIGQASRIHLRTELNSAPLMVHQNGGIEPSSSLDVGVFLYDWKTPAPAPLPFNSLPARSFNLGLNTSQEVRNRDLIIMHLVSLLGGAVTIQTHELEGMNTKVLESFENLDPRMLIIKVEDQ